MSKDPAILFYTQDFLTGCTDLTFEERGQYITLLCLQHQKGHLSEKTIRLSVGSASVDVLKKFLKDNEGNYYNERMEIEIQKRLQFIQTRIDNGLKGGRPKKANGKPNGLANGKANEKLIENENEDVNSNNGVPPKIEDILKYCNERKNNVDPNKFFDFYEAKGWMIGKNKMKDWKAAVRTWEKKDGIDAQVNYQWSKSLKKNG